ncbi:MAG: methylated-DNA--[protein]-cysteine S-methyltransferase [Infirmifilum sp.]|nr:methylated-DNA--[protein]-cysteine S-methyltransferase [Infirmifilum uzonense]
MFEYKCMQTPIGELCFLLKGHMVHALHKSGVVNPPKNAEAGTHASLLEEELHEYFQGIRRSFSFKPVVTGSTVRIRVLQEVMRIPYGRLTTYKAIAEKASTTPRVVASVLRSNHVLLLIPCHRVISSTGDIGGYVLGRETKKYLLMLEKAL